jgi:anti-sigma-K factor RskA
MKLERPDRSQRLDALAAEYALGTLPLRPRRRLARIAQREPTVVAALRAWELRLAGLANAIPPVTPPARAWIAICTKLGIGGTEAADATAAIRTPWLSSLGLWRGLAFAGFTAALVLGLRVLGPAVEEPGQTIVAVLAGSDAKPALVATIERGGRILSVKALGPIAIPPDRALELWALPEGKDPRSLGLVAATGVTRIALPAPAGDALRGVPALAISLEPHGGTPTGKPTGPVLYTGAIERI